MSEPRNAPDTESQSAAGAPTGAAETRTRILEAARRRLLEAGAPRLSMQETADAAGVSKGLIHYHFHDKETLLARLVEHLADGLVAREHAATASLRSPAAVDALWDWLDAELARGDVRALLELGLDPSPAVRAAARSAAGARRAAAEETVAALFAALSLSPRVPVAMLADVTVAFIDGLALDAATSPGTVRRVAYDVFWLALLSLAE